MFSSPSEKERTTLTTKNIIMISLPGMQGRVHKPISVGETEINLKTKKVPFNLFSYNGTNH